MRNADSTVSSNNIIIINVKNITKHTHTLTNTHLMSELLARQVVC